jgi:hypothetical protein
MKKIFTILLHPIPTRKCSMLLAPGSGYIRNKAWNTCSNLLKVKKNVPSSMTQFIKKALNSIISLMYAVKRSTHIWVTKKSPPVHPDVKRLKAIWRIPHQNGWT